MVPKKRYAGDTRNLIAFPFSRRFFFFFNWLLLTAILHRSLILNISINYLLNMSILEVEVHIEVAAVELSGIEERDV